MGQSNGKSRLRTMVPTRFNQNKQKNTVALHAMFDPEKLTQLSGGLKKISLNEIQEDNGLVFRGKYIPEELLAEILDYIDYKLLIKYQLVCKRWFLVIRSIVWRRKAERLVHRPLPVDDKALWTVFFAICDKKIPFGKNLIKNDIKFSPSWTNWCDMTGRPNQRNTFDLVKTHFKAPKDPMFNSNSIRYILNDQRCWKRQVIYLLHEGFPQYLLDKAKPPIHISEWYRCRRDSPGIYEVKIELVKLEEVVGGEAVNYIQYNDVVLDSYHFTKTFENRNHRGTWRKFKYQFRNYGEGLNRIRFFHGGQNHIEIGPTCITLELPKKMKLIKMCNEENK